MNYYTSDPHLGDYRVIPNDPGNYRRRLPFNTLVEHDRAILRGLNYSGIQESDTLFVLGDVMFEESSEPLLKFLPVCRRVLIVGNHDVGKTHILGKYFDEVHTSLVIETERGRVGLVHYPKDGIDMLSSNECDFILNGYIHASWRTQRNMLNVGVDVWGWAPIRHDKVVSEIDSNRYCHKDYNVFPYDQVISQGIHSNNK